jgi:hypothetical protein
MGLAPILLKVWAFALLSLSRQPDWKMFSFEFVWQICFSALNVILRIIALFLRKSPVIILSSITKENNCLTTELIPLNNP